MIREREEAFVYLPHRPSLSPARKGNCRSRVLNANVLGVYGVFGIALVTVFISHSLSERLSEETGECFICMSSTSILFAARSPLDGIKEYIPSTVLRRKMTIMMTVVANVPLAMRQ